MTNQVKPAEAILVKTGLVSTGMTALMEMLHQKRLQDAARAVQAISLDDFDMQRLAATFSGKLVHISEHQQALDEIARLKARVEDLEKQSTELEKAQEQLKEKAAELRALRKLVKDQQGAFRALLEFLEKTPEEIELILAQVSSGLEEERRMIEREKRKNRTSRRKTAKILSLVENLE